MWYTLYSKSYEQYTNYPSYLHYGACQGKVNTTYDKMKYELNIVMVGKENWTAKYNDWWFTTSKQYKHLLIKNWGTEQLLSARPYLLTFRDANTQVKQFIYQIILNVVQQLMFN